MGTGHLEASEDRDRPTPGRTTDTNTVSQVQRSHRDSSAWCCCWKHTHLAQKVIHSTDNVSPWVLVVLVGQETRRLQKSARASNEKVSSFL